MGGYGPGYGGFWHGAGPGMMGGWGPSYGMGPGMMSGHAPGCGFGPDAGVGWGSGQLGALKLTDDQRTQIASIQRDVSRKHWELMGKAFEERNRLFEQRELGKEDEGAERRAYQSMADVHKQMFETSLDARKRIDATLTPEQRDQLKRSWRVSR